MNTFLRLAIACIASVITLPFLHAETYKINDAGYQRTFELATDEVAVTKGQKRRALEKTAPAPGLAAMKNLIADRSRSGERIDLVVYETVNGQRIGRPRVVTGDVYFRVTPGADAVTIGREAGAVAVKPTDAGVLQFIAEAADSAASFTLSAQLQENESVVAADPVLARIHSKRLIPNDTYFTNQFHLLNTGQFNGNAGADTRVTGVWDTYLGSGILIGFVDDGIDTSHPDLTNINTVIDRDFILGNDNGNPVLFDDDHGTACAGIATAVGNNGIGVSGAAPQAVPVSLRLISSAFVDDVQESDAMNWSNGIIQIKSNSWGPFDSGDLVEGPGPLTKAALSNSCMTGRGGLGTLHFWAGGNGLDAFDDSNKDGYANSIYTISISAADLRGEQAWYSEPGANHIVCAISSGDNNSAAEIGTWTTDRSGSSGYNDGSTSGEPPDANYTATFGGTSSATPLAAGIGALMLEANSGLGWRDVQEILIRSATRNDPTDFDWALNGAGIWFSHKFGAGLINATGAVAMAETWTNLAPQRIVSSNQPALNLAIPDGNNVGVYAAFDVSEVLRVEHVVVKADISHNTRGDLVINLISPSNTISILADVTPFDSGDNYSNWEFMSVHNWGEMAAGTWYVQVADLYGGTAGTINSLKLDIYGTGPAPSNQPPVIAPVGSKTIVASNDLSFAVSASDPVDGDPVTLVASNLPTGAVFGSTNGTGSFSWVFANPVGLYNVTFHASDKDGFASETISIHVTDGSCVPSNIVMEGFDASTSVPAGWTDGGTVNDTESTHYQSAPNCRALGTGDSLITPAVNAPTQLMFFVEASNGGNGQTASVDYEINGGGYVELGTFSVSSSGGTEVFDLTSSPDLSGSDNVTFRFNSSFNTWYLDDVQIDGGCGTPSAAPSNEPPVLASIGPKSATESNSLVFAVSAADPVDGDPITLTASNLPAGAIFAATNGSGTFTWNSAQPAGVYTSAFYAADKDGTDFEVVVITVSAVPSVSTNCSLIISEYVEGSGNNKAIELYNPGPGPVDFAAGSYVLQLYFNGSTTPLTEIILTGSVAKAGTYIVCDDGAGTGITDLADQLDIGSFFNGDDAIVLRMGGTSGQIVDSIGQVGFDPGSEWGSGVTSTADNTLRRKTTVTLGDTNPSDAFDPSVEWDGFAQDTFDGLGLHDGCVSGDGPDADSDSMDDQWEVDNFGSVTNSDGLVDSDGDFVIDLHEFLAGTEPTNAASFLHVADGAVPVPGEFVITWPGVSGKSYAVSRTSNLTETVYSVIASNIPGVNPVNVYTDSAPPAAGSVYRIELE